MESAFIHTPLAIAKLEGDENGVSSITVIDGDIPPSDVIPEVLDDAVYQLQEYFEGKRQAFSLTLNPEGTDFQKKVWDALLQWKKSVMDRNPLS